MEKIFASHKSGKGHVSRICKNSQSSRIRRQIAQLKNRNKVFNRYFPKEERWMASKHMNKHSISLVIRERQIKITMIFHYMPVRMTEILKKLTIPICLKGVEELEFSYIALRNVKWYDHFGKVILFLKKLNVHQP